MAKARPGLRMDVKRRRLAEEPEALITRQMLHAIEDQGLAGRWRLKWECILHPQLMGREDTPIEHTEAPTVQDGWCRIPRQGFLLGRAKAWPRLECRIPRR